MPAESENEVTSIFWKFGTVFAVHFLSNVTLICSVCYLWSKGVVSSVGIFSLLFINLINVAFAVVVCGNTRCSIRRKNNIPQMFELEDYFLSLAYLRLVIAQLGRHTVDYSTTESVFFSATGLAENVEVQSETNSYINPQIQMIEKNGSCYV